jgi:ATP-dependent RNA helicase RhlE
MLGCRCFYAESQRTIRKGVSVLFTDLKLSPGILAAVAAEGYTTPSPIQAQAIPHVLDGKDVLGCAQTGTGKTAAFAMPILHRLSAKTDHTAPAAAAHPSASYGKRPRCLVLCPTRELAAQIADSFKRYGKGLGLKLVTIYGGVGQYPQVDALHRGVDIVIATPGRLMDLMEQRHADLSAIEMLVLDEADRMLDMGFIQPIRRICSKLPQGRQTLLFSATMAPEIRKLADSLLRQPIVVNIAPVAKTAAQIEESVYKVEKRDKPDLLAHLVQNLPMYRSLVFTKTKHGADRVVRHLHARGIKAEAIHGNKSQNVRQRALANFANNKIPVLVATDVASRGIDVDGITHVVNYDLTHEPETYVHRIGRTGRADATGHAVSFCDREEGSNLRAIERLTRRQINVLPNPLPPSDPNAAPAHRDHDDRPEREDRGHRPQPPRSHHRADQRAENRGYRGDPTPGSQPRNDRQDSRGHQRHDNRLDGRPDGRQDNRHDTRRPAHHNPVGGFGANSRSSHPRDSRPARPAASHHPIGRGAGQTAQGASRPAHPITKKPKVSTHRKGPRRPQATQA